MLKRLLLVVIWLSLAMILSAGSAGVGYGIGFGIGYNKGLLQGEHNGVIRRQAEEAGWRHRYEVETRTILPVESIMPPYSGRIESLSEH